MFLFEIKYSLTNEIQRTSVRNPITMKIRTMNERGMLEAFKGTVASCIVVNEGIDSISLARAICTCCCA